MDEFTFTYPTKVYFGNGVTSKALTEELKKTGKTVMLAYGGGSVKKNGIYDRMIELLQQADKEVVEFPGIMSNPTYAKVQEGACLAKDFGVDFILAVGGGSVVDCCKIIAAQAKTDEDIWEMEFTHHRLPTEFLPMGAVVTAYGLYAFVNRDIADYMFLRSQFVFFDFNEPLLLFILDYLAIMGFFVFLAYYLTKRIRSKSKK